MRAGVQRARLLVADWAKQCCHLVYLLTGVIAERHNRRATSSTSSTPSCWTKQRRRRMRWTGTPPRRMVSWAAAAAAVAATAAVLSLSCCCRCCRRCRRHRCGGGRTGRSSSCPTLASYTPSSCTLSVDPPHHPAPLDTLTAPWQPPGQRRITQVRSPAVSHPCPAHPPAAGGTCILRFIAGPPYEDLAFRILNKEWWVLGAVGCRAVGRWGAARQARLWNGGAAARQARLWNGGTAARQARLCNGGAARPLFPCRASHRAHPHPARMPAWRRAGSTTTSAASSACSSAASCTCTSTSSGSGTAAEAAGSVRGAGTARGCGGARQLAAALRACALLRCRPLPGLCRRYVQIAVLRCPCCGM